MPITTVRWKEGNKDYDAPVTEFLNLAASDPAFPWPYPIARSMLEEDLTRPSDGLSITALLKGCIRCRVLEKYEGFSVDIQDLFYRWRGSMFHTVIENYAQRGAIVETRFWAKVPELGLHVHGKPDIIVRDALVDAKTTRQVPRYDFAYSNHVEQGQFYRWLVNHAERCDKDLGGVSPADIDIRRIVIWYIDGDGVKPIEVTTSEEVATKAGAKNPYKKVRRPNIWSDEEVEALLIPRYRELYKAFSQYEQTGVLPDYPPGFDYINDWTHRYSPVATLCVERHINDTIKGWRKNRKVA